MRNEAAASRCRNAPDISEFRDRVENAKGHLTLQIQSSASMSPGLYPFFGRIRSSNLYEREDRRHDLATEYGS
jgi:hypothetical protein